MKPSFEHIAQDGSSSIVAYWREEPAFAFNWHYHPEFELTYIHRGSGSRLVGDQIEAFHDGDLVLLGPNLPHTWATDEKKSWAGDASAMVIQFNPVVLGDALLQLPELAAVQQLLEKAGRGIAFHSSLADEAGQKLAQLTNANGIERLSRLLLILHELGTSEMMRQLASPLYVPNSRRDDQQRIDRVFRFLHHYFAEQISLADLAAEVHMTETSFCRFFKKMAGRPYTDYLNDLRVNRACQLLVEGEESMPNIAYTSGFNSMTHFNRMFLKKKNMTPGEWRKKFHPRKI